MNEQIPIASKSNINSINKNIALPLSPFRNSIDDEIESSFFTRNKSKLLDKTLQKNALKRLMDSPVKTAKKIKDDLFDDSLFIDDDFEEKIEAEINKMNKETNSENNNDVPSVSQMNQFVVNDLCTQNNDLDDFKFTQYSSPAEYMDQIENAIVKIKEIHKSQPLTSKSQKLASKTLKPQNGTNNDLHATFNSTLCELFKSTQYKREIEETFNKAEQSILDDKENVNHDNELSSRQNTVEKQLEHIFRSPEVMKKVLKHAEESVNLNKDQIDASGRTLADAILHISKTNTSFERIIKTTFLDNINSSFFNTLTQERIQNANVEKELFQNRGDFFGLPDKVKDLIKVYKGIEKLYDWQIECLQLPAIETRRNLVYALPTSGGKTLVAEVLILREILCRHKNAIFILPYVAIVQEKVWALSPFAVALDFLIEEYAAGKGNYPPRKRRRKNSIYICTIEKALGLMNSLIENDRTDEVGLVVVDELHLLGEGSRGACLESLLTKIKVLKNDVHIIGMSATIGNINDICEFLNADVYSNDFRPVELVEFVKCQNEIARVNKNATDEEDILEFEKRVDYYKGNKLLDKLDPDQIGGLVMDVIPDASCLVFCKSRQNCENVSGLICKVFNPTLKKHRETEKQHLKNALVAEVGTLCNILATTIDFGVAYHHSGLTAEERRLIEDGFRQGIISVICCTSTLAAGVNLPAKRVIIRNPYLGRDFINLARYKQMIGRAGRAGFGEIGESILVCQPRELPQIKALFLSPMDVALSSLHDNSCEGLQNFLLSCVSLGMASTKRDLEHLVEKTLMAVQADRLKIDVRKMTRHAIKYLFKWGALKTKDMDGQVDIDHNVSAQLDSTFPSASYKASLEEKTKPAKKVVKIDSTTPLEISKLGLAAMKGGLDLNHAHIVYEDLLKAQASLVLFTGLHLMYLVVPYQISEQVNPNKSLYYTLYSKLDAKEVQTAKVLGITDAVATKLLTNRRITEVTDRVLNRFYVTLMLYDLWNEMSVYDVSIKYDVNRGLIQNLMTSAATFASNVYHFCAEFEEFWAFSLLLKGMSDRLSHCCVKELIPLMKLPSVKQNRAKQLFVAGYRTLQSVARADPELLMQQIEFMSRKLANQLIAAAKMILLEKVENLREEAEDVIEGVNFTI